MKVSVIVPVYNGESYICTCLVSLLNQTYVDWEAILINDGSTDNSLALLTSFAEKDTRFIVYSQKNSGVAVAREMGIQNMKGDYVTFLDIDDTLAPNYIEKLLSHFETGVDIVTTAFNIIQEGKVIRTRHLTEGRLTNVDHLKKVLSGKLGWELCAKMYRKDLFDIPVSVPAKLRIGEDAAIYIQLVIRARKVKTLDEPLYNYIQYSCSATHVKSKRYAEETLQAAFYIDSLLQKESFYKNLRREVDAMFLLFYSNSIRKAILGLKHPLVYEIYKKHYSFDVLKLLPWLKGIYVTFSFILGKIFFR